MTPKPLALATRARAPIALGILVGIAFPACAKSSVPFQDRDPGSKGLLVAGAILCTAVYTPVKAAYAVGGTVAGGLVFLMSAGQSTTAAARIIDRGTRGDWVVHPDHLTGNRPLHFNAPAVRRVDRDW